MTGASTSPPPSAPQAPAAHSPPGPAEPAPLSQAATEGGLGGHVQEFLAYAGYWLRAEVDVARAEIAAAAVAALWRLVLMVALVATAVVLLLTGCATGLGQALGGRPWLGNIIVGGVTLACTAVVGVRWRRDDSNRTEHKYADLREEQRERFGRDVSERAALRGPDKLAYLRRQSRDARAAMAASLDDMREDLDPRAWVRDHPWATLAVAAGAGLAAARVMGRKEPPQAPPPPPSDWKSTLLRQVMHVAEPALAAWLASLAAPRSADNQK